VIPGSWGTPTSAATESACQLGVFERYPPSRLAPLNLRVVVIQAKSADVAIKVPRPARSRFSITPTSAISNKLLAPTIRSMEGVEGRDLRSQLGFGVAVPSIEQLASERCVKLWTRIEK
jgi:hypothetical protein